MIYPDDEKTKKKSLKILLGDCWYMDFLYHSAYKPVQPVDEGAFQATAYQYKVCQVQQGVIKKGTIRMEPRKRGGGRRLYSIICRFSTPMTRHRGKGWKG